MSNPSGAYFAIVAEHRDLLQQLGLLSAEQVFADPRLVIWRDLPERDNGTLDAELPGGQRVRLHVKRDKLRRRTPVDMEATGIVLMEHKGIASAPLVAAGRTADGRSCVITLNLENYRSADRLLDAGVPFDELISPTLDTVVRLHRAGLHHRDLYLSHFYIRQAGDTTQPAVRLIDAARVRKLPLFFPGRWIVKDVAQFIFSLGQKHIPRDKQEHWLSRYVASTRRYKLPAAVWAKARRIARHDDALNRKHPTWNVRLTDGN